MDKENNFVSIIILGLIIWGVVSFFSSDKKEEEIYKQSPQYESYKETKDCFSLEPSNPYGSNSGHYAGFEWGEQGNSCGGNSNSFIEGCEEYQSQEDIFTSCENNQ